MDKKAADLKEVMQFTAGNKLGENLAAGTPS